MYRTENKSDPFWGFLKNNILVNFIKYSLYAYIALILTSCTTVNIKGEHPEKGMDLASEEDEVKFGYYVDASIKNGFMVLLPEENPKVYQKVQELGQNLVKVCDRPNLKYTFQILNTDLVNAFAGPGGYVYVTTGLLDFTKNKDEVAGVIAHEIGHVSAKHVVKQFRNITYAQTLTIPIIIGSTLYGYKVLGDLSQLCALFFLMGYSRDYERQADYLAVKYILKSTYNPEGMVYFLKRLWEEKEKGNNKRISVFLSSHPETQERIKDIQNYIKESRGENK